MSEQLIAHILSKMQKHVIVVGYGFLGMYVVQKLKDMELEFVVLVRDETKAPSLHKSGIPAIASPISRSYQSLKEAGAGKASSIICTLDDDGDNMLAILNAKKINPGLRAITVVNDKDHQEAALASGADIVVAPYEITGQILAMSTASSAISAVFVNGPLKARHIAEFAIANVDKLEPVRFWELNQIAPVVMVSRNGKVLTNLPEQFQIEKGDRLYALVDHGSLLKFEDELIKRGMLDLNSSNDRMGA
jgi:Trk K+ transport system NAD-binding subunit